jgi:hypothetical protein
MNDDINYIVTKNKAEEYERKKTLVKQDVILDAIVAEVKSIICDYQDTMSKDFEQCLKNLIDQIEGYKQ